MSKSSITTEKKLPPIHPGRILLEDLKDEQISINGLAQAIRVPANRISLIVNEKRGITADTAARLGRYFGTSAQYWLNIQNRFDLDCIDCRDRAGRYSKAGSLNRTRRVGVQCA
jgi:addiction module HigA family antidote